MCSWMLLAYILCHAFSNGGYIWIGTLVVVVHFTLNLHLVSWPSSAHISVLLSSAVHSLRVLSYWPLPLSLSLLHLSLALPTPSVSISSVSSLFSSLPLSRSLSSLKKPYRSSRLNSLASARGIGISWFTMDCILRDRLFQNIDTIRTLQPRTFIQSAFYNGDFTNIIYYPTPWIFFFSHTRI